MSSFKMVPVVATEVMQDAGANTSEYMTPYEAGTAYSAMLAAAPPFVVTDEMVEEALVVYYSDWSGDPMAQMRAAIEAVLGGGK